MDIFKLTLIAALSYATLLGAYMSYETRAAILQGDDYGFVIGTMITFGCWSLTGVLATCLYRGVK